MITQSTSGIAVCYDDSFSMSILFFQNSRHMQDPGPEWDPLVHGPWPNEGVLLVGMRIPSGHKSLKGSANFKKVVLFISNTPSDFLGLLGIFRHCIGWRYVDINCSHIVHIF